MKPAADADPNGALAAFEFSGDRNVFELVDNPKRHGLSQFRRELLKRIQRRGAVDDALDPAQRLSRFFIYGFSGNAEPLSSTIGDLAAAPIHCELAFGDPVKPRYRGTTLGVELTAVAQCCTESLCTEIRGDFGIIGTPIEVPQETLSLSAVESIESRRVAESVTRVPIAHQPSLAPLEPGSQP